MRLFFALDPDEPTRAALAAAAQTARSSAPDAAWTAGPSLHITLVFVGNTAPERLAGLEHTAREVATRHGALRLTMGGGGVFGEPPRVLWLGVDGGPPLGALQANLAAALRGLGIEVERRAFTPHLTLARARRGGGDDHLLHAARTLPGHLGAFTARDLVLYRTERTPSAATYAVVSRMRLGGLSDPET